MRAKRASRFFLSASADSSAVTLDSVSVTAAILPTGLPSASGGGALLREGRPKQRSRIFMA